MKLVGMIKIIIQKKAIAEAKKPFFLMSKCLNNMFSETALITNKTKKWKLSVTAIKKILWDNGYLKLSKTKGFVEIITLILYLKA